MKGALIIRVRKSFSQAMGAEIARLRRNKALSGRELGSLVGLSQQQISRYENGVCEIPIVILCNLLFYLDTSLDTYFYFVSKRLEQNNPNIHNKFAFIFEQCGMNITQLGWG
ncbi:helix-turn-helix transcriptional regulator [Moellerella wisconsensis]|uniref:helix-turn-helix domain-containing protein n=1 Tax=Moellerella wisconsensis TaxID=158849 RepID=UPI0030763F36